MPHRPKRPCKHPGCPNLTDGMYCEEHSNDNQRLNSSQRGYDYRWRKVRQRYLNSHPFCVKCMEQGRYTLATVVDHIKPHRGDERLLWDENNFQALCKACHDRKTWREDSVPEYSYGEFGGVRKRRK